jgi:hypothetical protein
MKRILFACLAFCLLASGAAADEVTATLEPAQVSVGDTAQLTVTVNGSQSAEPSMPDIPGLDIVRVSQSTQVQMINGDTTISSAQTYEVTPQHAGNFTIPPIRAGSARSKPLSLRVTGSGSANSAGGAAQSPSGTPAAALPPPNVQMPSADNPAPGDGRFGFIQVAVPKSQLYVGELLPVDISAFIPARMSAQTEGPPTLTSDGLALNPLGPKPEQKTRVVNGRPYIVLTWHTAVTAIKAGEFSLGLEMPIVVMVREQQRHQRTGNDLFDQFFNDSFAREVQKEVKLTNEPVSLAVQELPDTHRPAEFGGAIGQFELHASAAPTKVAAGDPITLRLELSGSGDFDRASSTMVAGTNGWKTYPPKSSFQADDSASYKGTKTFEQLIIPEDDSVKEIPALSFSFFDPKTGKYETCTTQPILVTVSGAPAALTAANVPAASSGVLAPSAPDLVPNKVEPGHFVASLQPVFMSPWFIAAQGLPLCALAGGLLFLRRQRRLAADPRHARASAAERAIAAQLAGMDQAIRQHASSDFFLCARSALQQRLGERWDVRPETITLAEISTRMNGAGDGIRPIFEMADQASYSGQNLGDADFRQWRELVVAQLKALEKES